MVISPSRDVYAGTNLATVKGPLNMDEQITPLNDVTYYNDFYEFARAPANAS